MTKKNNIKIYAKSALSHSDIISKDNIGHDGIEVQLLSELIGSDFETIPYKKVFNLDEFLQYNINVIHSPLYSEYEGSKSKVDCLIENIDIPFFFSIYEEVFKIADYFGKKNNKNILIIFHSEMSFNATFRVSKKWYHMLKKINYLLNTYRHTKIGIENVSPLRNNDNSKKLIKLSNNIGFDNIEMVKALQKTLLTNRVGTVFDTCHAEITYSFAKNLENYYSEIVDANNYTTESYFDKNKEYISLIHLSKTIDNGYGKKNHGKPFCDKDYSLICKYMDLYKKYEYSCPITLEVSEEDYKVCDGYKSSKALLSKYINENFNIETVNE